MTTRLYPDPGAVPLLDPPHRLGQATLLDLRTRWQHLVATANTPERLALAEMKLAQIERMLAAHQ